MRITLNLASRPYVDLRPLSTRLRLWMALLAILAVPFFLLLRVEQRRASVALAEQTILTRDMQKLKQWSRGGFGGEEQQRKAAIFGALMLYLDFINLFLSLLRIFGSGRS